MQDMKVCSGCDGGELWGAETARRFGATNARLSDSKAPSPRESPNTKPEEKEDGAYACVQKMRE
jgi:hypothetical protein